MLQLLVTLLPAAETYHAAAVQQLWQIFDTSCAACLSCTLALHSLQSALEEQACSFADGLLVRRAEAVQRLLSGAKAAVAGANRSGPQLSGGVLNALLEALLFHRLLRDEGMHPPAR